ncbi:MAG: hypothetical protein V1777_01480 [Candidatus Micrarchaeota archaeon]
MAENIEARLADWVTFVPNKDKPIHNWLYYKEGYSEEFVNWCLKKFQLKGPVFDPFCGVGTTLVACKKKGIESMGTDVSPLACLASRAKTRNYDLEKIGSELEKLRGLKPEPIEKIPVDPRIRKLFYHSALETVWFYKTQIEQILDEKIRELFLLALIDTTGRVANVVKVGGSLRKQKKPDMPVAKLFLGKITKMAADLKSTKFNLDDSKTGFAKEPAVWNEDCRRIALEPESIGSVITSPPYLNKIEYTSVYKLELGLFFGYQETRLRAFVGDNPNMEPVAEFAELPLIGQAYFLDLKKVLNNLFPAIRPGGVCVFNIAGGCLPHGPVQSDEYLEKIAATEGFELVKNITARKIWCHADRSFKTGQTKDAVVVFKKPQ